MTESKHLKMADILKAVCRHYDMSFEELKSRERSLRYSVPRHTAMYLLKKHTNNSAAAIARKFERDHTSILYAIWKFRDRPGWNADAIQSIEKSIFSQ